MQLENAKQPAGLIATLADVAADHGDRCDAAIDLAAYDEPEAEAALLSIALNHAEDPNIADEAGHSLWEIWSRNDASEPALIERLHPEAKKFFSPPNPSFKRTPDGAA
eukprot:TRINITY_DN25300_c0_g1_i1.p1 TRINITY_DN25300_c0_g1~~TRINITY_DN25300_c0_g1_i1.p1  ORF type:complete len:108 (+),score=3.18 TRINITY_DN25300_c0_g1_i1:176-499(+)